VSVLSALGGRRGHIGHGLVGRGAGRGRGDGREDAAPRVSEHDGALGVLLGCALLAVEGEEVRMAVGRGHVALERTHRAGRSLADARANGAARRRDGVGGVVLHGHGQVRGGSEAQGGERRCELERGSHC
jgi:hypothetical protein